jgi:dienelactone hydrolase
MKRTFIVLTLLCASNLDAQTLPGLTITNNNFTYEALDGNVTGIIRLPAGSGPFPAVLISHGKGGSPVGFSLQHANILVGWGFACIGPEYTHVGSSVNTPDNEGYCPENSRRARRAIEILAATPGVDMTRLALFGHSMGSFMSAGLAGEIPAQIKAACISAGGTAGQSDVGLATPAVQEVQGITAPFLMFHGTADTTVVPSQSVNLQNILTTNGVPNKRLLYQDIGHDIINTTFKRTDIHAIARAWFTQHGVLAFAGNTTPTMAVTSSTAAIAGTSSAPLAITLDDAETTTTALTIQAFTTDDTRLPNSSLVLGGTGANRTLTITPPSGQSGTVEVSLVVNDGQLARVSFLQVTIQPAPITNVNHRPTITWIADQRSTPGTAVNGIAFTIDDAETTAALLTITATSSNATLLPLANIVLGGSGASRTVSLTPVSGQSGTTTITLTVSDGTKSSAMAFTFTVAATVSGNTAPTIQSIASETIAAGTVYGSMPLIVRDTEQAETTLTLTATSSNTTLVPVSSIVFGGQSYGRTLQVTPAAGQSGRSTITVTVSDGTNTSSIAFVLDVVSGDAPPLISGLPTVHSTDLGSTPAAIAFIVNDAETATTDLRVTAFSSNTSLVPDSAITLGGNGTSRSLTISPLIGQTGAATITLSLSDGSYSRRAQLLMVVTDASATAAQFSRPRGVFILDSAGPQNYTTTFGSTISLRDANLRSLPFVDGFTLRVAWNDIESGTTPGHYDFFIIQNLLNKLPLGQRLSIIIVPSEPAYIATTPGVQTWSDAGLTRATPWDSFLRTRRRAMLTAMGSLVTGGVALRDDPRLDVLDPYLPGGFTGVRDPNSTPLRNLPSYSRENLLAAVRDELSTLQQEFPGKFVQIGFWPITDSQDANYSGVTASEWIRQRVLAEFNGLTRPRVGFFMENLAARRVGPNVEPYSATPVTGFGSALFNSRNATWNGFQMLGSWTRPFNDGHVTNTLHGTPNDGLEYAFNTYRAEYHEVYIGDIDNTAFQPGLQRWHDFYASTATTNPGSDEDGDGLPLAWEQQYGISPLLSNNSADDDHDGLPLLLEYAFNQHPGSSSASALPTSSTVIDPTDDLTYLHYHYLRRSDAPQLSYTVEVSPDLKLWQNGPAFTQEISSTPTSDGVTDLVTVRLLPALGPGSGKSFLRVRVSL